MIRYNYKDHESLLVKWYSELLASGDFDLVFHKSLKPLTDFLEHFRKCMLLIRIVEDRITAALWFTPWMDGVLTGIWLSQASRFSKSAISGIMFCLGQALKAVPVVIGLTKQPALKQVFEHAGFQQCGEIPLVWDGKPVQAYFCTKDMFRPLVKNGH